MKNRHFFTVTVVKKRQKLRSERDFGDHNYTALTRFQHLVNKAHIHFCLPGARNSEKQRGFGLVALKSTAEVFECCRLLTCQHYILFICPVQKFWAAENLVIKKFQYAFALKRCHNGCCNTGEIANFLYRSRTRIREELYNLLLLSGKFRRFSEGIIEFRELYHFHGGVAYTPHGVDISDKKPFICHLFGNWKILFKSELFEKSVAADIYALVRKKRKHAFFVR